VKLRIAGEIRPRAVSIEVGFLFWRQPGTSDSRYLAHEALNVCNSKPFAEVDSHVVPRETRQVPVAHAKHRKASLSQDDVLRSVFRFLAPVVPTINLDSDPMRGEKHIHFATGYLCPVLDRLQQATNLSQYSQFGA
jgi:hypothetical protein